MRQRVGFLGALLACAFVLAAPAGAGSGPEGTRISLLPPGGTQTVPAAEATYIEHCWLLTRDEWRALRGNQRLFLDDELWFFEGEADGVPLSLARSFRFGTGADGFTEGMRKCWSVSFPAGTFAPGQTVYFSGRFVADLTYDGVADAPFEVNRTVVFT